MTATPDTPGSANAAEKCGIPERMRVLFVTTPDRPGSWLSQILEADGAAEVAVREALGASAGAARLRDECYDAVLIHHVPEQLDALELVEALRAGGAEDPIVVLGGLPAAEMVTYCFEVEADDYIPIRDATTRSLLWVLARAMQRHRLIREHRRLTHAQRHQLQQEQHETERVLAHQRAVIRDLEALHGHTPPTRELDGPETSAAETVAAASQAGEAEPALPAQLVHHYRELLRAYVIMGSGNLSNEMKELARLLASFDISPQQTMQVHLQAVENLIHGLGRRSTRHVMTRADLLMLEVMVHLAENYRRGARQQPIEAAA